MPMDEHLCEKLIAGETIYDGHVVHLERWVAELPNGNRATREIIRHVGASAVVALDDEGYIHMVRQFRAAVDRVTLEIPAGKLDHVGADPLACAKRELGEETGLEATSWQHLGRILTTVGFCDEKIDLYLARGLVSGSAHPDDDEFVEVIKMPFDDAYRMATSGQIEDAKTITAILLTKLHI